MEQKNHRRNKPISTNKWIGILLLLTIPLVNLYFIIYWAFVQKISMTRRNFSRAIILWFTTVALITVLLLIVIQPDFKSFAIALKEVNSKPLIEENMLNFVE